MASIGPGAGRSALQDELSAIRNTLAVSQLAEGSKRKYGEKLAQLERFLDLGLGVQSLADVERQDVERFIAAPSSPSASISVGTMHVRRAVVRFTFRAARK